MSAENIAAAKELVSLAQDLAALAAQGDQADGNEIKEYLARARAILDRLADGLLEGRV